MFAHKFDGLGDMASERAAQLRPLLTRSPTRLRFCLRDKKANISTVLNVNADDDVDVHDQVGELTARSFEK